MTGLKLASSLVLTIILTSSETSSVNLSMALSDLGDRAISLEASFAPIPEIFIVYLPYELLVSD